ncbi:hypothetical protein PENTCL1PPCAC_23780, partial [Pristionchus entomophagus]
NSNLSITVINPNEDDVKVSFNYYNAIFDYSSAKHETLTLPAGAIYTHYFPSSLAWEHMNGGFQEQFDTRIGVNTTAPVSLYANNYNKDGFGDSYLGNFKIEFGQDYIALFEIYHRRING